MSPTVQNHVTGNTVLTYFGSPFPLPLAAESTVSASPVGWVMGVGAIGILCVVLFLLCFAWTKERVQQIDKDKNVSAKVLPQRKNTVLGERLMISIFPAISCILAFWGMMFYPLSDKRVKEISEELKNKRNNPHKFYHN